MPFLLTFTEMCQAVRDNTSRILSDTTGQGDAGDIYIHAKSIVINGDSLLLSDTTGQGNAGDISINAANNITVNNSSIVSGTGIKGNNVEGNSGNISFTASMVSFENFSFISTESFGDSKGDAGDLDIDSDSVRITEGSIVTALTSTDSGGGDINIFARDIFLIDGGKIVTATSNSGTAGNINLNIIENITIDGTNSPVFIPNFSEPILRELGTKTGLFASTEDNATGNGGNINITTTNFSIVAQGEINASGSLNGNGGNINIDSKNIELNSGIIQAETSFITGGNINLEIINNLILRQNSNISARAFQEANGGNLSIDSRFIIAFSDGNNDIVASADQGKGGNININAESVFGIQNRELNPQTNDINASSNIDGLDGIINISTPNINPVQGVTELPSNVVEPEQTIEQACKAEREAIAQGSLIIEGKGGITPDPALPLNSLNTTVNGKTNQISTIPQPIETSQGKIQPARGVKVTESGEVVLTAYRTSNSGDRIPSSSVNCDRV